MLCDIRTALGVSAEISLPTRATNRKQLQIVSQIISALPLRKLLFSPVHDVASPNSSGSTVVPD